MMKKRSVLLTACLIVFGYGLLAGCVTQDPSANTIITEQGPIPNSEQGSISKPIISESTKAEELSQSQFMPLVNSADSTTNAQTTSESEPMVQEPAAVTSGEPPTPTLFWPTPASDTIATPFIRPAGAAGQDLPPERWQEWPVIPVISDRALEIYRAGIAQGNDPARFSKVGDCQNIRQYFLGIYDEPGTFKLGDQYGYLQETIDHFYGSWGRVSESVRTGFNVASVLAPLYANPQNCQPGETPLACEIRIWNPSVAIISMETWTEDRPVDAYETYLRQIVEYTISQNVMPIVATKADNLEGDHAINQIVARVAADYDIPMWNFWAATQPLTDQGLMEDGFHLTNGPSHFDSAASLDLAWPIRNLTALQLIDEIWKMVR